MHTLTFVHAVATAIFLTFVTATSASDKCDSLAPQNAQDIEESFKGDIEGQISGLLGKLTGGTASLSGEYKKIVADTLHKYPDSHRLYVWQRIIYLACIDPDLGIDINKLFELYIVGPPKDENAEIDKKIDYVCTPDSRQLVHDYKMNGRTIDEPAILRNSIQPNMEAVVGVVYVSRDRKAYRRFGDGRYSAVMDKSSEEMDLVDRAFRNAQFRYPPDVIVFLSYTEEFTDVTSADRRFTNSKTKSVMFIDTYGVLATYSEFDVFDPQKNRYTISIKMRISKCMPYQGTDGGDRRATDTSGQPVSPYATASPNWQPQSNSPSADLHGENCDRLAGNEFDGERNRKFPGAPYGLVSANADAAIASCRNASEKSPGTLRYKYQLARALQASNSPAAKPLLLSLTQQNYGAAFDNLGWLFIRERKIAEGVALFSAGSELGNAESMVSLGRLLNEGKFVRGNRETARGLFASAARQGHPLAMQEMQNYNEEEAMQDIGLQLLGRFLGEILR